jgi:iron complex outermembrane receptor protein
MFWSMSAFSQLEKSGMDSTDLQEAVVRGHHSEWSRSSATALDSGVLLNYQGSSLSDVLAMAQPLHLKSYGNSGLATISYRGLDATSLNLIWKGVKLNSSFNGSVDFSTIPAFFFDQAQFFSNTSSSYSQAGAIGADMVIGSSKVPAKKESEVFVKAGSFQSYALGFKTSGGFGNQRYSTKIFGSTSENNYPIQPIFQTGTKEENKLQNAAFANLGFMHEHAFKFKSSLLEASIWLQKNDRELPPTLLEAASVKNQHDRQGVLAINWVKSFKSAKLSLNNSVVSHSQNYIDSNANIDSHLERLVIQNSAEFKGKIDKALLFYTQWTSVYAQAKTDNYTGLKTQWYGSQNSSLKFYRKRLRAQAGFRSLTSTGQTVFLFPYASAQFKFKRKIRLYFASEKAGRLPTLNELYWEPGGKPDLKPMTSWKHELGLVFQYKKFRFEQVAYQTDVENNIQWLPQNGIFAVYQSDALFVSGTETHLQYERRFARLNVVTNLTYNNTQSKSGGSPANSIVGATSRRQVAFVPIHTGAFSLTVSSKNFFALYMYSLTSKRNVNAQDDLDGYYLHDISLGYRYKQMIVMAKARNISGLEYYVLPYRPMPGRNFAFTTNYTIPHTKEK